MVRVDISLCVRSPCATIEPIYYLRSSAGRGGVSPVKILLLAFRFVVAPRRYIRASLRAGGRRRKANHELPENKKTFHRGSSLKSMFWLAMEWLVPFPFSRSWSPRSRGPQRGPRECTTGQRAAARRASRRRSPVPSPVPRRIGSVAGRESLALQLRLHLHLEPHLGQRHGRGVAERDVAGERLPEVDVAKALRQREHPRQGVDRPGVALRVSGRASQGQGKPKAEAWPAESHNSERDGIVGCGGSGRARGRRVHRSSTRGARRDGGLDRSSTLSSLLMPVCVSSTAEEKRGE